MSGEGKPPPELKLAWMMGDHLPDAGGYFDQDYKLMYLIRTYQNIYAVCNKLRNLQGEQIHSLTTSERRVIKSLRELDLL